MGQILGDKKHHSRYVSLIVCGTEVGIAFRLALPLNVVDNAINLPANACKLGS